MDSKEGYGKCPECDWGLKIFQDTLKCENCGSTYDIPVSPQVDKVDAEDKEELIQKHFLRAGLPHLLNKNNENHRLRKAVLNIINEVSQAQSKEGNGDGWISVENEPKVEGEYLCCKMFDLKGNPVNYFIADYKLNRYRNTNELVGADEDGIKGCWVDKNGYGQQVTHWMLLPKPPILSHV